jgi:hypothetical protein
MSAMSENRSILGVIVGASTVFAVGATNASNFGEPAARGVQRVADRPGDRARS